MRTKSGYRSDVIVFPVWVDFVSESPSFSECHTRSRIARPYVFHQVGFMGELAGERSIAQKKRKATIVPPLLP